MGWKAVGAVAACILTAPAMVAADPSESLRKLASVTVHIYNNFGVPSEDLRIARAQAEAIFRDAGLEIVWVDCWVRRGEPQPAEACRQALDSRDAVLRLQANSPEAVSKYVSMGFSLVSGSKEPAYLSTVFVNVVWSVAHGAGVDPRDLLGLAIAHELGHVLLNTNSHARTGLMRANWSRAELRRADESDSRFLSNEAATMRQAVEGRVERRNGN